MGRSDPGTWVAVGQVRRGIDACRWMKEGPLEDDNHKETPAAKAGVFLIQEKTTMAEMWKLETEGYPLPIGKAFIAALEEELTHGEMTPGTPVYVHFRDPNYSKEFGGFRPIEVYIDETGRIRYITEFTWVGMPPMEDLVKSVDFDLAEESYQDLSCIRRIDSEVAAFWKVWSGNFLEYRKMGVFDVALVGGP